MLSQQVLRIENDGSPDPRGPMSLAGAFFNPSLLASSHDLEVILHGLAAQPMQEVDVRVVDGVRNFLFGPPGAGGLDLAALNIQRGRDHGLPDYNSLRAAFGLPRVTSFAQITSDVSLQQALQAAYGSVDDIDPWVGALAEDHLPGSSVGPLLAVGLREQFRRLRDGDRFWYENDPAFRPREVQALRRTTLADVIRRNTGAQDVPDHVFFVHHGKGDTGPLDALLTLSSGTAETSVSSGTQPAGALVVSPPSDPGTADSGSDEVPAEPTSGSVSVGASDPGDEETGGDDGLEELDLLLSGADLWAGL
jgi:peroxidase